VVEKELRAAERIRSEVIEVLESQIEKAEQTIRSQKDEINHLKSNIDVLMGQVRKLALFANGTKFEGTTEANSTDEPMPAAADQPTVSPDVFERIANELIPIIGPLATTVVHHDVAALGESVEIFPQRRLPELLEILTKEISDENLKHTFRKRFVGNVQLLDR